MALMTFRGIANQNLITAGTSPLAPGAVADLLPNDSTLNLYVTVGASGPTSARPTSQNGGLALTAGLQFFDTTLGYHVVYDGAAWRNPSNGSVV